MRSARALALALVAVPLVARAQVADSIVLGERVRVSVAATHGDRNLFFGNVAALAPDTLTLAIPGGKGTVILPRASISEIARSDGRESRFSNIPKLGPILITTAATAALPAPSGSMHANGLRNFRYAILGMQGLFIGSILRRTPPGALASRSTPGWNDPSPAVISRQSWASRRPEVTYIQGSNTE